MSTAPLPILLVEDNPLDLDLTLRSFKRKRLANPIQVARDGEEAIAHIARWEAGEPPPLLILLDLHLPRRSGLEVLAALKARPPYDRIPVVVLTTSRDDGDVARAYDLGANSYIVKPVDFAGFEDVVDRIEAYWCLCNLPPPVPS